MARFDAETVNKFLPAHIAGQLLIRQWTPRSWVPHGCGNDMRQQAVWTLTAVFMPDVMRQLPKHSSTPVRAMITADRQKTYVQLRQSRVKDQREVQRRTAS